MKEQTFYRGNQMVGGLTKKKLMKLLKNPAIPDDAVIVIDWHPAQDKACPVTEIYSCGTCDGLHLAAISSDVSELN